MMLMSSTTSPLPLLHYAPPCHINGGGDHQKLDEEEMMIDGKIIFRADDQLGILKKVEERVHVVDVDELTMTKTSSAGGGGGGPERVRVENRLTAREMDSLTAICDTLLPSLDVPPDAGDALAGGGGDAESLRTLFGTSASMLGVPQVVSS